MTRLNDKNNIIINTKDNTYREIKVKTFKYCWQCSKELPEGSTEPFCNDYDNYCRNEYYAEQRKEADACYREWIGENYK